MVYKNRSILSLLILTLLFISIIFILKEEGPQIDLENRFSYPSLYHPLGTDELGKDVLSMTLLGLKNSFMNIFTVFLISAIIGMFLGAISSIFYGRFIDNIIVVLSETLRAFPGLLLVLAIASLGGGIIVALLIYFWIPFWRLFRTGLSVEKAKPYFEAAIALGRSRFSATLVHTLPNVLLYTLPASLIIFAEIIAAETILEFLGIQQTLDTPFIGMLIFKSIKYPTTGMWIWLPSVFFITVIVFLFVTLGERAAYAREKR